MGRLLACGYGVCQAVYALKALRAKGFIVPDARSRCYRVSPGGIIGLPVVRAGTLVRCSQTRDRRVALH